MKMMVGDEYVIRYLVLDPMAVLTRVFNTGT